MKWWFALLSAVLGFALSWFLIVRARRAAGSAVPVAAAEPVADEADDAAAVRDDTEDGETEDDEDDDATAFGGEATSDVSAWVVDDAPSSHWQADALDEDAVLHHVGEGTDEEPEQSEPSEPELTEPELVVPPVEGTVSGNGDLAGVTPEPQGPGDAEAGTTTEEPEPEPGNETDAPDEDSRRP